jgi:hypothetical protein
VELAVSDTVDYLDYDSEVSGRRSVLQADVVDRNSEAFSVDLVTIFCHSDQTTVVLDTRSSDVKGSKDLLVLQQVAHRAAVLDVLHADFYCALHF